LPWCNWQACQWLVGKHVEELRQDRAGAILIEVSQKISEADLCRKWIVEEFIDIRIKTPSALAARARQKCLEQTLIRLDGQVRRANAYVLIALCERDGVVGRTVIQEKDVAKSHFRMMLNEILKIKFAVLDNAGHNGLVAGQVHSSRPAQVANAVRDAILPEFAPIPHG
jgi:hypothetical protein